MGSLVRLAGLKEDGRWKMEPEDPCSAPLQVLYVVLTDFPTKINFHSVSKSPSALLFLCCLVGATQKQCLSFESILFASLGSADPT